MLHLFISLNEVEYPLKTLNKRTHIALPVCLTPFWDIKKEDCLQWENLCNQSPVNSLVCEFTQFPQSPALISFNVNTVHKVWISDLQITIQESTYFSQTL